MYDCVYRVAHYHSVAEKPKLPDTRLPYAACHLCSKSVPAQCRRAEDSIAVAARKPEQICSLPTFICLTLLAID